MPGQRRRNLFLLLAAGIAALAQGACGSVPRAAPDVGASTAYEAIGAGSPPVILAARDILPAELLEGDTFELDERVLNDGLTNTYTVYSDFGTFEAEGDDRLRSLENELEVMGALRDYEVTPALVFGLGVVNGAENYVEGALQLLAYPIRSIAGVPRGLWRYATRITEMTREQRTWMEDSYFEELIGFSQAKRQFATLLQVDVYSTNPELRSELDRLSWPSWGGGILATVGTVPVAGIPGLALTATGTAENFHLVNRDTAPEDQRLENRRRLKAMGVGADLSDALLGHRWYSPRVQSRMVDALYRLDTARGQESFVRAAVVADDEGEAFLFQRLSELLLAYHQYQSPIAQVSAPDGLVIARAEDGAAVVPLVADLGTRTPGTRRLIAALDGALATELPTTGTVLWVTGRIAPDLAGDLRDRGWRIEEDVFRRHLLAYEYQELMAHREAIFGERILPLIGE